MHLKYQVSISMNKTEELSSKANFGPFLQLIFPNFMLKQCVKR